MGRKRPRELSSAQQLVTMGATFVTVSQLSAQGFVMPGLAPLFAVGRCQCNKPATVAAARRLQPDPRQRGRESRERNKDRSRQGLLDPDDPLPRTMEEVYRRIASEPALDLDQQYAKALEPRPEEMDIIQEAVRTTFKCTEDDAWWDANREEWERMAESPGESFALGVDKEGTTREGHVWEMEDYFGEETPEWELSKEAVVPFSLSAYKAGTTKLPARLAEVGEGRTSGAAGPFDRTPFAKYWDALPDLRTSGRVYAYNAVDRMAALKFMMNCTFNGMHGSAESMQSGHFLWGYVDQLDWMRRSGRLSSTPGSIKVDPDSWWGRVSYALTIVPLAALVESSVWGREVVPAVSVVGAGGGRNGPGQPDDLQLPEMRRAVRAWRRVWRFSDAEIANRVMLEMPVHDALQERVRRAQWAAHLESLEAVEALYGEEFDKLPSDAEREFARGWCRAARLFAEAAAHTDLDRCLLPLGAGYAPERTLTDDDANVTAGTTEEQCSLESVPFGPPDLVAEAESDSAVVAVNTRRCVASVRWLGTLRAPVFGTLRRLWRRSCTSYPARRKAARVLRDACYGGRRAKTAAWGKSFLFLFVPNLNYRKLTFPLGVDPAEVVEYDPDFELRDMSKPPPRPAGSRPLNPLQWPWYDGRRPDPSAGLPGAGWGMDDDGLLGSSTVAARGMFPPGRQPVDVSFEAMQRREREIMEDLRAAREYLDKKMSSKSRRPQEGRGDDSGGLGITGGGVEEPEEGEAARSTKTLFM